MIKKPLCVLKASAGSGKTFNLAANYLTLLFKGKFNYSHILAITFTNKATSEMKGRILSYLKDLSTDSEDSQAMRLTIQEMTPGLSGENLKKTADEAFRQILHHYNQFSVSTIDGFVQKVIRSFSFELGLDNGYKLELNLEKVKKNLAQKLDKELDQNEELRKWTLNLALERIGNGKSWNYKSSLIELSAEIFKEQYQPFAQALEHLEKTTGDLNSLFELFQRETKKTIHQFESEIRAIATQAWEIIEQSGLQTEDLKGKSRSPLWHLKKIKDGQIAYVEKLQGLIGSPEAWFGKGAIHPCYDQAEPLISLLKEKYDEGNASYLMAKLAGENIPYLRLLEHMSKLLKQYREENGIILISDAQILLSGIIGEQDDNPSFIWEKTGSKYHHFLFDEFQDTSIKQWNNFRPLLINALASNYESLIVGDIKQSIYRWRNGDWNILHQGLKKDIGTAMIAESTLNDNFRSSKQIIAFNNALYSILPDILQNHLNEITAGGPSPIAAWWKQNNYDHIITNVYSDEIQKAAPSSQSTGTVRIKIIRDTEDGKSLTKESFQELALQKLSDEIHFLQANKHYSYKEIGILVRTNKEAVLTVNKLMADQIPVLSAEALQLQTDTAVSLLLSTLKLLSAPLEKNRKYFKSQCLSLFKDLLNEQPEPEEWLKLNSKENVPPFLTDLEEADLLMLPLSELIEKLIIHYGLNNSYYKGHIAFLLAFQDLCLDFTKEGEQGIRRFLDWWETEGFQASLPSSEDTHAVQVITIHKAKGLAFKAVFCPFCNWTMTPRSTNLLWVNTKNTLYESLGSLPIKFKKEAGLSLFAKDYYEEILLSHMDSLNMLYVATTRAKEYLWLCTAEKKTENTAISNIGDAINQATEKLQRELPDIEADQDGINFGTLCPIRQDANPMVVEAAKQENEITMEEYPVSDRLKEAFREELREEEELEILTGNEAAREGALLHQIVALCSHTEQLERVTDRLVYDGYLSVMEKAYFIEKAKDVLNNEQLQALAEDSLKILTEKNIITPEGNTFRPDRIIFKKNGQAIILDYKFGKIKEDRYLTQIKGYKNLLAQMGFSKVSAYLFYAQENRLQEV